MTAILKNCITKAFRGKLLEVFGVYVCATLQQKLAGINEGVSSGAVKGCFAPADAVKE
jgi:hypothetical protein